MQAIRSPRGIAPLGPLKAKRAIAIGHSQSAKFIYHYTTLAQNDAQVFDGIISDADIYAGFDGQHTWVYPDLRIPFIQFNSEDTQFPVESVADPKWYRRYDVVGASHADADLFWSMSAREGAKSIVFNPQRYPYAEDQAWYRSSHYGEEGPSAHATCIGGNQFPRRYALNAVVDALNTWLTTGVPAPASVEAEFDAGGAAETDSYGNRKGGWRLPLIDVPVATYRQTTPNDCPLPVVSYNGTTVPLATETLADLYPTHDIYVAKMQAATDAAVAKRWMLPADAEELMAKARASKIPGWR